MHHGEHQDHAPGPTPTAVDPPTQRERDWAHWAAIPLITLASWALLWLPVAVLAVTSSLDASLHCRTGYPCHARDTTDLEAAWVHVRLLAAIGWLVLWLIPPARGPRTRRVLRQVQLWAAVLLTAYLIAAALTHHA